MVMHREVESSCARIVKSVIDPRSSFVCLSVYISVSIYPVSKGLNKKGLLRQSAILGP